MVSWIGDLGTSREIMLSINGFVVFVPWKPFSFNSIVAECSVCINILLNMFLVWFY